MIVGHTPLTDSCLCNAELRYAGWAHAYKLLSDNRFVAFCLFSKANCRMLRVEEILYHPGKVGGHAFWSPQNVYASIYVCIYVCNLMSIVLSVHPGV